MIQQLSRVKKTEDSKHFPFFTKSAAFISIKVRQRKLKNVHQTNLISRAKDIRFIFSHNEQKFQTDLIIVPTLLEGGGTIYSNGFFFVQSILADRYIHRRELRLVSLESLSSVEYGIKKRFFLFSFLTGRYRGLNF